MNSKLLIIISVIVGVAISLISFPQGVIAVSICAVLAVAGGLIIRQNKSLESSDKQFLLQIFLLALILRAILAALIFSFNLELIFAPDATGYDAHGNDIAEAWIAGLAVSESSVGAQTFQIISYNSNWGIYYIVGAIYYLIGRNALAVQLISAVFGALTVVIIYLCAQTIFRNRRTAQISALAVAVFPAMILWSSQLLKDGFVIFILALSMLAILRLREKISYFYIVALLGCLAGVHVLRFYVFFMVIVTAVCGFVISSNTSLKNILRYSFIGLALGLALTYLGIWRTSQGQLEALTDFEVIERSRQYSASSIADSSYNRDADVSTLSGALYASPIGFIYLLMAPFPWQMTKITQLLTLPEMVIWWACLPFIFLGFYYAVRHRFRECIPILLFVAMLSLSYSISQGNLGTMYRQRTQIQVFLLMFAAVGICLQLEKREQARMMKMSRRLS